MILGFALAVMMTAAGVAQDCMKGSMKSDSSAKAPMNVTGKISDDGKSFVSDKDSKTWTISNPDAVKGVVRAITVWEGPVNSVTFVPQSPK